MNRRLVSASIWILVLAVADASASDGFRPVGDSAEGLPKDAGPVRAYSADPASPLNELITKLYQVERSPEEIGAAIPSERGAIGQSDADFYQAGWYFRKREGGDSDRIVVGGDVRISPVERLSASDAARVVELAGLIETSEKVDGFPELRAPIARLMLQWDLWNAFRRAESLKDADPALLRALAKAVRACGQSEEVLRGLPSGLDEIRSRFAGGRPNDRRTPYVPVRLLTEDPSSPWVEMDRNSTKLFHGASTYRSARVFLNAGSREASRGIIEAAARPGAGEGPVKVPEGTEAALVLALVGLTPDLKPVATPVVDEVRIRSLAGPRILDPAGETSSRDGLNIWTYLRTRHGTTVEPQSGAFRFVPDTTQAIFLEYGTAKRTTYAAQCTLCHRTTNDGGQVDAGFRSLGMHAKPRVVDSADARFRLAEREVSPAVQKLKGRLVD